MDQWRTEGGLGELLNPHPMAKFFVGIITITQNASKYSIFNQKY